ncbi:heme biosynthesis protein HemY [Martelella endophytica]|uniref:HemY domain-containing protein n=1 Tax=Martelella endophytica TaxID=1486262 RepID=A0A0D5LTZ5_MAREN|nr:heme biosynthesis protein HemY [Martelella endophytica]AJY47694.1 HemY domain-containing protein [Martelella endophytica]
MIRLVIFAIIVLAFALGFSWFADRPGELSLVWQGHLFQTPLTTALALLIALIFVVMVIWWLITVIWTSPNSVRRYFRARKRDRGYQAISTGLIAAGSGNLVLARKMSTRAHALLRADQEPLIHMLDAQVALIEGDHDKARRLFERMSEDPETAELGLRGLYLEAKRLGADEAARQYAERAADKAPYLAWAAQATLESRTRQGRWDDAIRLLDQQRSAKVMEKQEAARLKSVLLTARAESKLETDPKGASADALQALKLRDDFHPAAIIAAKAYLAQGSLRKSAGVLEMVWKKEPHPQIAALYVRARGGDTAVDRLRRAEKLEALKPNNPLSLMAVARAALDAREFATARTKAEAAARMLSRESAFLLLADIEEAETGDQGRVRHWMAQALRAGRDPTWVADGLVSEYWRPFSPTTGKIDAFEWKVPYGEIEGPVEEGSATRLDEALKSLPPIGGTRAEPDKSDAPIFSDLPDEDTPDAPKETTTPPPAPTVIDAAAAAPSAVSEAARIVEDEEEPAKPEPPAPAAAETPTSEKAAEPEPPHPAEGVTEDDDDEARRDPVLSPFGGRTPDDPGVGDDEETPEPKRKLF